MQNNTQYNYMGMFWLVVALAVMLFIFQFMRWDTHVQNMGGGVSTFVDLTDTPPTFNGHGGNCALVAPTEDRLVFGDDCDGIQAAFSVTWYTTSSGAPGATLPVLPQNVIYHTDTGAFTGTFQQGSLLWTRSVPATPSGGNAIWCTTAHVNPVVGRNVNITLDPPRMDCPAASGLTESEVGTIVRNEVYDWAEQDNTTIIPVNKLPPAAFTGGVPAGGTAYQVLQRDSTALLSEWGQVRTEAIQDDAVTVDKIADDAVGGNQIFDNGIFAGKYAVESIVENDLAVSVAARLMIGGGTDGQMLCKDGAAPFIVAWCNAASLTTSFTALTDTPNSFPAAPSDYIRVNAARDGLEFIDAAGRWGKIRGIGTLPSNTTGYNEGEGYITSRGIYEVEPGSANVGHVNVSWTPVLWPGAMGTEDDLWGFDAESTLTTRTFGTRPPSFPTGVLTMWRNTDNVYYITSNTGVFPQTDYALRLESSEEPGRAINFQYDSTVAGVDQFISVPGFSAWTTNTIMLDATILPPSTDTPFVLTGESWVREVTIENPLQLIANSLDAGDSNSNADIDFVTDDDGAIYAALKEGRITPGDLQTDANCETWLSAMNLTIGAGIRIVNISGVCTLIVSRPDPSNTLPDSPALNTRVLLAVNYDTPVDRTSTAVPFLTSNVRLPSEDNRGVLSCYTASYSVVQLRNNCAIVTSPGFVLSEIALYAGSTRNTYSVSSTIVGGLQHTYLVNGLHFNNVVVGEKYQYNFMTTAGAWSFFSRTLPGDYTWNGMDWAHTPGTPAPWAEFGNTTIIPIAKLPGTLLFLLDDAGIGQSVTAGTLDNYGGYNAPTSTIDVSSTDNAGKVNVYGDITVNTLFANITVNQGTKKFYFSHSANVNAINRHPAYVANMTNGVPMFDFNIYNGTTRCGTHTLYLVKNASNNLGYYWHYDGDDCNSANWSLSANMTIDHVSKRG